MKKAIIFLLLTSCSDGGVHFAPTAYTKQSETTQCASWHESYCETDVPGHVKLEAVRLLDQVSLRAMHRLDDGCVEILARAGETVVPAKDAEADVMVDHCDRAHAFIASFAGEQSARAPTCTTHLIGCEEVPIVDATCSGAEGFVTDRTGMHAEDAMAAGRMLQTVMYVRNDLGTATDALAAETLSEDVIDPQCEPAAMFRFGEAAARVQKTAEASDRFGKP